MKPPKPNTKNHKVLQLKMVDEAIDLLPMSQKPFFGPQFQVIGSLAEGSFVGLACRSCGCWLEFAHESDCPAPALSERAKSRYRKFIRKCREQQWKIDCFGHSIAGKEFAY